MSTHAVIILLRFVVESVMWPIQTGINLNSEENKKMLTRPLETASRLMSSLNTI